MVIPNLLILGFPKCGTTSVADTLDQHPDAVAAFPNRATHHFTHFYTMNTQLIRVSTLATHYKKAAASNK